MITYEVATRKELSEEILDSFVRYSKTTQVLSLIDGELVQKGITFTDEWNQEKLRSISTYLMDCVSRDGTVVLAKDNDQVIGFSNLEPTIYCNHYINMSYIHVSRPYRGKGIGKVLFQMIEKEAKKYPVQALYISAHPSVEVQAFYANMGCTLATQIIPELYEKEPYDIQLEKELK